MLKNHWIGPILLSLLFAGTCFGGVMREDRTFEVTLPSGEVFTVKVKFGLGYTSEKKVDNVDFSLENRSESGAIGVTRARIVRISDNLTLRGETFDLSLSPQGKIDKEYVLKREKLEEYYWQVVTELSVNFNGVTKFFIFATTKMDKEITLRDRPF